MGPHRPELHLVVDRGSDPPLDDFEAIFRRYAPYVARIGLRLLGDAHAVDDLVQDVFMQAHRGLKSVRRAGALKGWLATITVRTARRRLKRHRWLGVVGLDPTHDYSDLVAEDAPQEDRVFLTQVYRQLERLPPEQRIAWVLRALEGEKLERVAELCGCSLATTKRRIAAAQRHLEEVLHD